MLIRNGSFLAAKARHGGYHSDKRQEPDWRAEADDEMTTYDFEGATHYIQVTDSDMYDDLV